MEEYKYEEYKNTTTDQLKALEEQLYDMESNGVDCWFERDRILNELNYRDWK